MATLSLACLAYAAWASDARAQAILYVANNIADRLSKVGPGGGAATTFATGLNAPTFLAFGTAAVPEPSPLLLAGAAGTILGALRVWRRRRAG